MVAVAKRHSCGRVAGVVEVAVQRIACLGCGGSGVLPAVVPLRHYLVVCHEELGHFAEFGPIIIFDRLGQSLCWEKSLDILRQPVWILSTCFSGLLNHQRVCWIRQAAIS